MFKSQSGTFVDLRGTSHDDILVANATIGELWGGRGDDTLIFSGNIGQLNGGAGNDVLIGSGHLNELWGGPGSDTFVLNDQWSVLWDFKHGTDHVVVPHGTTIEYNHHLVDSHGHSFAYVPTPIGIHDLIFV